MKLFSLLLMAFCFNQHWFTNYNSQSRTSRRRGQQGEFDGMDSTESLPAYSFPFNKVNLSLLDDEIDQVYIILLLFGTFSPITNMHLRALEMARDELHKSCKKYQVIAGYISPVSDSYQKNGLPSTALCKHRIKMCQLATADSTWLMVDDWECQQDKWTKTIDLLDHFNQELVKRMDGRAFKIGIVMGSDLFGTLSNQSLWSVEELQTLSQQHLIFVIERGTNCFVRAKELVLLNDVLFENRDNIVMIEQFVPFSISATKVRLLVKRGYSVNYLVPICVAQYIFTNNLYRQQ